MKMIFAFLVCTLSAAAVAGTMKVTSVSDIGSMTRDQDGNFEVTCADGSTEYVSELDIKLNNVCPKIETANRSRIKSATKRADGLFDVTCVDGAVLIADATQIIAGGLCPFMGVIEDGRYRAVSGHTSYYDQDLEVVYANGVMTGVNIKLDNGYHAELTCNGMDCTGKGSNGDDDQVRIIDTTHYEFFSSGVGYWATFEKN